MAVALRDPMSYRPGMESLESPVMAEVMAAVAGYHPGHYGEADVRAALARDEVTTEDFAALLSPAADPHLEAMAARARELTLRHHGNGIAMFTPLYLANYCQNECTYCGFSASNRIHRASLTPEEMEAELAEIAATGLQEVLLLTGESEQRSGVRFIGEAAEKAARHFAVVGIEVQPLNTEDYAYLHDRGVDYVAVYQETYDLDTYSRVHLFGPKRVFPYRFDAPERALKGGMRGVAFGALLGLGDARRDAFAVGMHARSIQRRYPHAEITLSVPRLRPYINHDGVEINVTERQLLQVMLAYRLLLPYAGITISTRERAGFRDNVAGLVATRMSAGVSVGVGGHAAEEKGDEQFEISDTRSLAEIHRVLVDRGLQPVYRDHIRT
ncbi:2-iminoacetate synthase ThiH [Tessaracoccus sp. G1721]